MKVVADKCREVHKTIHRAHKKHADNKQVGKLEGFKNIWGVLCTVEENGELLEILPCEPFLFSPFLFSQSSLFLVSCFHWLFCIKWPVVFSNNEKVVSPDGRVTINVD